MSSTAAVLLLLFLTVGASPTAHVKNASKWTVVVTWIATGRQPSRRDFVHPGQTVQFVYNQDSAAYVHFEVAGQSVPPITHAADPDESYIVVADASGDIIIRRSLHGYIERSDPNGPVYAVISPPNNCDCHGRLRSNVMEACLRIGNNLGQRRETLANSICHTAVYQHNCCPPLLLPRGIQRAEFGSFGLDNLPAVYAPPSNLPAVWVPPAFNFRQPPADLIAMNRDQRRTLVGRAAAILDFSTEAFDTVVTPYEREIYAAFVGPINGRITARSIRAGFRLLCFRLICDITSETSASIVRRLEEDEDRGLSRTHPESFFTTSNVWASSSSGWWQ